MKIWQKPTLRVFGSVEEITRTNDCGGTGSTGVGKCPGPGDGYSDPNATQCPYGTWKKADGSCAPIS